MPETPVPAGRTDGRLTALIEHDVARIQTSMHAAAAMGFVQRERHFPHEQRHLTLGKRFIGRDAADDL